MAGGTGTAHQAGKLGTAPNREDQGTKFDHNVPRVCARLCTESQKTERTAYSADHAREVPAILGRLSVARPRRQVDGKHRPTGRREVGRLHEGGQGRRGGFRQAQGVCAAARDLQRRVRAGIGPRRHDAAHFEPRPHPSPQARRPLPIRGFRPRRAEDAVPCHAAAFRGSYLFDRRDSLRSGLGHVGHVAGPFAPVHLRAALAHDLRLDGLCEPL